jgi:hypothetical protein
MAGVKSVVEIYLKISYSFPCERINIFVTVIHFGHANISEKVKEIHSINTKYKCDFPVPNANLTNFQKGVLYRNQVSQHFT